MRHLIDRLGYVPRSCVWELTRACNLRCDHCGSAAGAPRDDELSRAECLQLVADLAALGCRLITLSGGEPTVHRHWPDIARAAVAAGITTNLVTNGQSDPHELARLATAAGLANVGVSFDGLEQVHDAIRRPGAFTRAATTVEVLSAAGIWVDMMVTVNRHSLDQLVDLYALAGRLGARGFRTQLSKPMGNQTHRADLTLEPRHTLQLLPTLGQLAKAAGPTVDVGDSIGYYSPHERALRGHRCSQGFWTGCYAGCRTIGIQADGGIKGCLSLQPRAGEADRFLEGNLRQHSLSEIWHRPGAFAYNRGFTKDQLTGACATCPFAETCRGGATCVAHSYTGQLGCDPMCYFQALSAEQGERRAASWLRTASAAAAGVALSVGGIACTGEVRDDGAGGAGGTTTTTTTTVETDAGTDAAADAAADAEVDAAMCAEVDCACLVCPDYGINEPCYPCDPVDLYQACCCDDVCCMCDYGDPGPPEKVAICCEPFNGDDYGVPPPPPGKP